MLSLLECVALESIGDLRISFALRLTGHREVHSDLGALPVEVVVQALENLFVLDLAVAEVMLASPLRLS